MIGLEQVTKIYNRGKGNLWKNLQNISRKKLAFFGDVLYNR